MAVGSFHTAYTSPSCAFLMLLFAFAVVRLARARSGRHAAYGGLLLGVALYGPQLGFFWTIFGPMAAALWVVLAFWLGLMLVLLQQVRGRWGMGAAAFLAPVLWMGCEFFRSELYGLRFTWLNVGYAYSQHPLLLSLFGVYGMGFVTFALASAADALTGRRAAAALVSLLGALALVLQLPAIQHGPEGAPIERSVRVAAIQMEFPLESQIVPALERLRREHPETELFALSEYTFDGPIPKRVADWCREHGKYLVAGGKDKTRDHRYFNTAFVMGPDGTVVFQQAKSVPIQFFEDGLPATSQQLWHSPWGDLGICICYDLSYTRVTDTLIRAGAQALIVPTMDVVEWGEHQHRLHARVAPTRSAEYGVPILRVASSGISQLTRPDGVVVASAPFAGEEATLFGGLPIERRGHMPWDRALARICVGITAIVLVAMFVSGIAAGLRNRRKS